MILTLETLWGETVHYDDLHLRWVETTIGMQALDLRHCRFFNDDSAVEVWGTSERSWFYICTQHHFECERFVYPTDISCFIMMSAVFKNASGVVKI